MTTTLLEPVAPWHAAPDAPLPRDPPVLMGILNVTPDSFSDGGRYIEVDAAVAHAARMIEEGAAIIDIGGESSRPGAARVDPQEQLRRVIPVVTTLRQRLAALSSDTAGAARPAWRTLISIDTTQATVAKAALDAGADLINDVSAGRDDPWMFSLAAQRRCGLILMHRLAPPAAESYSDGYSERDRPRYRDVVAEVRAFLMERAEAAIGAGVRPEAIAIDPGLGFGKTVAQNYELIARSAELVATGFPVVTGASRKSFIGRAAGVEAPGGRVIGSVAAAVGQYLAGVRVFRVHDVAAHLEALAVAAAVNRARESSATGAG
jgi:dihydropteroate synthase